jgi:hypothetical protein
MKWCFLFLSVFTTACAAAKPSHPTPPALEAVNFVDMATVPWNFVWRQAITAQFRRPIPGAKLEEASFEAVLQKQGRVLTMVGLTAFGTRAFVAHQEGAVVKLDEGQSSQLPFPPEFIFLDVNRCFFAALSQTSLADGSHEQTWTTETISDTWKDGRLVQRVLRESPGRSKEPITIRYTKGFAQGSAPQEVELVNERFGYRLKITTLESENL